MRKYFGRVVHVDKRKLNRKFVSTILGPLRWPKSFRSWGTDLLNLGLDVALKYFFLTVFKFPRTVLWAKETKHFAEREKSVKVSWR